MIHIEAYREDGKVFEWDTATRKHANRIARTMAECCPDLLIVITGQEDPPPATDSGEQWERDDQPSIRERN